MMGDDLHHDDPVPDDDALRRALHRLADSAAGAPPLSGAQVRALAGGRGRRTRLAVVPAAAVGALLAGATAYALAGSGGSTPQRQAAPAPSAVPVVSGVPRASASPAPVAGRSGAPAPVDSPSSAPVSASPAATASLRAPWPTPSGSTGAAACAVAPQGEILVLLRTSATPGGLLSATPVSCVQGRLMPSGPAQQWALAPGVAMPTTTADQLFAVRRDATGLVVRLDKVLAGHL